MGNLHPSYRNITEEEIDGDREESNLPFSHEIEYEEEMNNLAGVSQNEERNENNNSDRIDDDNLEIHNDMPQLLPSFESNTLKTHEVPSVECLVSINQNTLKSYPIGDDVNENPLTISSSESSEDTQLLITPKPLQIIPKRITSQNESEELQTEGEEEISPDKLLLSSLFEVSFSFDTAEDCKIQILWTPYELKTHPSPQYQTKLNHPLCDQTYFFSKGYNKQMVISEAKIPPNMTVEDLTLNPSRPDYFPLIIILSTVNGAGPNDNRIHSQTLYATFEKNPDNSFALSVLRLRIQHQQMYYNLYDVYGLTQYETTDGLSCECVICMTNEIDTTLIPCRHMCLCYECSEIFATKSEKCPICRSHVKTMLKLSKQNNIESNNNMPEFSPEIFV